MPSIPGDGFEGAGRVDADLACTQTQSGGEVTRLGVGLPELEAMTLDPWTEADLEGGEIKGVDHLLSRGRAVHNASYVWWLSGGAEFVAATEPEAEQAVCEAFQRFGRVIGYGYHYREDPGRDGYPELPQVSAMVHVFQTEDGAKAFMAWQPSAPWHAGFAPEVAPLKQAGSEAVLVSSAPVWNLYAGGKLQGRVDVALVRRGVLVGEVFVSGPTNWTRTVHTAALGVALGKQMDSVTPTGEPFDVVQVVSAPLTKADWAALRGADNGYPELITGIEAGPAPGYGGDQPWEWVYDARQWAAPPVSGGQSSVVGVYKSVLVPPLYDEEDQEFPAGGTQLFFHRDESTAAAALDHMVGNGVAAPGGLRFDVPGIDGAVGVRYQTPPSDPEDGFIGYTWNVYFTHGPAVARAFIAGGPEDDSETQTEPEANWPRNQQWAIDAATAWDSRLHRVLG